MKTLSIRQPYAWLIVNGLKDIENRSWPTEYRGPVLVHAGKTRMTRDDWQFWRENFEEFGEVLFTEETIQYGGIVGAMNIVDCVTRSDSPWFEGEYGFVIDSAMTCDFIPLAGRLGFFDTAITVDLTKLEPMQNE
jgi:hypothetical protein